MCTQLGLQMLDQNDFCSKELIENVVNPKTKNGI